MKKAYFILYFFSFSVTYLTAQIANNGSGGSCKGIYLSAQDYRLGKLSFYLCDSLCGRIRLNHFFSGNHINIQCKKEKTILNKDSIFGYHDAKSGDYRFYNKGEKEYGIMENGNIVIYSYYTVTRSSAGRIIKSEPVFYFSKTLDSPIVLLTVSNLKRAFPGNNKFHDLLDLEFGDGKDISEYNNESKTFKVNYLLNQTNKQNNQ